MTKGTLHLIPTTLGDAPHAASIPASVLALSCELQHYIAENEKTARRYLKSIGTRIPLNDLVFSALNKHTEHHEVPAMCAPLLSGLSMGLISEAGLAALADPGAAVVAWCHRNGVRVVPHTGPSSITLALIASGFNGQGFSFHGYLPIDQRDRIQAIRKMERDAGQGGMTQIFMETPFRNQKLFDQLMEACSPSTLLCIACDITLDAEFIASRSVKEWKKTAPNLHKRPCMFLIGEWQ